MTASIIDLRPKDPAIRIEVAVDVGLVPHPHEHGGQYVVTAQLCPIANRDDAQLIAEALMKAIDDIAGFKFVGTMPGPEGAA